MDIGRWLRGLGLGQYEVAFRENKIDSEVLRQLTEEDLKDIGAVIVGDRRKMLTAIAELSASSAAPGPAAPEPSLSVAERRQLTVVFCDLVGSTALSARLDLEDMGEVISSYHRFCANCVEREGGFVAKYMGDGVLAYFGYPQAHEHDTERAVQAGLSIVEAAPKLVTAARSPLHVRVGIATGLVEDNEECPKRPRAARRDRVIEVMPNALRSALFCAAQANFRDHRPRRPARARIGAVAETR